MTPRDRRLLVLSILCAALAAACVPTQRAVRSKASARGTEAWSWRMSATDGRWSSDRTQNAARAELAARPAGTAAPEPAAAVEDDVEMTLEPDPVGPAKKPKAVAVAPARPAPARKAGRAQPVRASDSDEEFLDKILNDNADADSGEITMAAMELPKAKREAAPVKKKRMTRAERRRARLLARAEKKRAKQMAAREGRLRGKRTRVDEEEQSRAKAARKAKRSKKKGQFDENGEGFIDDEEEDEGEEEDDVEREIASGYVDEEEEDGEEEDEEEEDEEEVAAPARKKARPAGRSSKAIARSSPPAKKVKTDWSGQAVDDEDPLKSSKKK